MRSLARLSFDVISQGVFDADSLPGPALFISRVEQKARARVDGDSFVSAWDWGDHGGFQRHLRVAGQPLSLSCSRSHGASGGSQRKGRGLVDWSHWAAAQAGGPGEEYRKHCGDLGDVESDHHR